ncbi:MAG: type I 3-dehydroquinate dehydratase, partial [Terriglobia bacterium]
MAKHNQPRILVTVAAPTLTAAQVQADSVGSSQVGYEWRLDYLQDFAELERKLHEMLFELRFPHSIATCRRVEAGGLFNGSVEEQAQVLAAAVRAGCHWVDVEIESVDRVDRDFLRQFKPAKILVSCHDYRKMPRLSEVYGHMRRLPVQAIKIAGHVTRLTDNLLIQKFLRSHHRKGGPKLVMVGLGPAGLPSRLLSLKWGSAFTYASAGTHLEVASGQLPAHAMRAIYRVERLNHRTQFFGIVGARASVSLSPSMHNAAFSAKHLNAIYLPCETNRLAD